jgi:hypothetical protein
MPDIVCPECGQVTRLEVVQRNANEFCSHCNYPLFWARSVVTAAATGDVAEASRRRMPGAGGRLLVGTRVCPACGELNPLSRTHCLRCAADLNPPPPEPPPPPPPPPPAPLPPPPEPVIEKGIPWWVWLLVAVAFVIVTVLVIIIVT